MHVIFYICFYILVSRALDTVFGLFFLSLLADLNDKLYIYIYIYIFNRLISLVGRVFTSG